MTHSKLHPIAPLVSALALTLVIGCAPQEHHRVLQPEVLPRTSDISVRPATVTIGEFTNRSTYMNGLFADAGDRLGKQAHQILTTHLSDSRAFHVVDRRNMEAMARESKYSGAAQKIEGAGMIITGAVTEFGRRETGTRTLGGLLQKSRTQTLYGKVSLSVVDVKTSRVLASYQGAGEYGLTNSQVLGTGGVAGYDSTLADKVLNLAIMEAVDKMVRGRAEGEW